MAFTLHRLLLRQLKISANRTLSSQSYTPKSCFDVSKILAVEFIHKENNNDKISSRIPLVSFTPRSLNLDLNYLDKNTNISSRIIKCPVLTNLEIIEPPKNIIVDNIEDFPKTSVDLPASSRIIEKQAAKLIVIRRNKMKTHKLKKLRKKMRFEWAKVRQKREMRKEKAFQAELIAQIKEAEQFDATNYVTEKIRQSIEVPIPRFWKGKRLPEFIIREKLGLPKK